ncbi:Glucose-repressible alcohol dehydrogenase transcriptional effector [Nowakowskiella sp. JEL0078]|nr:Glucose-repressible alcohol dehydrogenase transcriptional effector [Nowakowskiella sp. JEL0078]
MSQHSDFRAAMASRPVSAGFENPQRVNQQIRPASEVLVGHNKSPEAEGCLLFGIFSLSLPSLLLITLKIAIDRWFEDLSYYERTLEQMAKAKLDDNFREELKAIEQWFSVLTYPERTTALYGLLQHTTQVQIRFFITVLQQMVQKDPVSVLPTNQFGQVHSSARAGISHTPGMHVAHNPNTSELMNGNFMGRGARRVYDRHSAPTADETFSPMLGFHGVQFPGNENSEDFAYKRNSSQSATSSNSARSSIQMAQSKNPEDLINSANWSVPPNNLAPGHERTSLKLGNGSANSIVTSPRTSGSGIPEDVLSSELAKLSIKPTYRDVSQYPLSGSLSPITGIYSSSTAPIPVPQTPSQTPQALLAAAAAAAGINHPGNGWGHVDITPETITTPPVGSPAGYARSEYSDSIGYESGDNSSNGGQGKARTVPNPETVNAAAKEKGKIPESIDLEALKDIPAWLRSLRLHKYTPIFEKMDWKEMINMSDEDLTAKGVAALGARRKMLKVFEVVKKDLEAKVNNTYLHVYFLKNFQGGNEGKLIFGRKMSEKDQEALAYSYHINGQSFYPYPGSVGGISNGVQAPSSPQMNSYQQQIYSAPRYGGQLHYASKSGIPTTTQMPHPLSHSLINSTIYPQQQLSMTSIPGTAAMNSSSGNGVLIPVTSQPSSFSHQRQIDQAQISRQTDSPHHHARLAVALSRSNGNGNGIGTIAPDGTPILGNSTILLNGVAIKQTEKPSEWTVIDLGGMKLKNISTELFRYSFLTTIYLSHNNLTSIPSEISKLFNLSVLDVSGNKLKSIPAELGLVTNLREVLMYDNQLTSLPPELGFLYQLENLGIEGNPLAEPILSMSQKEGTTAVVTYLRDSCPVGPTPPEREWIPLEGELPSGNNQADVFTVFCYNTLCEKYATPQAYGYTPSWALAWDYRKENLLNEINAYNPDICCLQEVEWGQYEDFFRENLHQQDYDSVYFPKSRARTMSEYERRSVDGCVIFFKTTKFTLIEKDVLEFQQIAMSKPEFRKSEEVLNRVMMKDNIAVVTLLENKETHERILVANAHLHWDPQYKDVKLVQTAMLVDELQKLADTYASLPLTKIAKQKQAILDLESVPSLPVMLCGDFNSLPNSGVYEYLSNATVPNDHEDFLGYQYAALSWAGPSRTKNQYRESSDSDGEQANERNLMSTGRRNSNSSVVSVGGGAFTHRLQLKSAYSHVNELDLTNLTPRFKGVIDYIWYSASSLEITGLLGGLDREYVQKVVGFPNWHFASDHIPLFASIRLRRGGTKV